MNVVCIAQARMGSSRFSGKVLMKIKNKPIIELIYERLKKCKSLNKIIFAVPNSESDQELIEFLSENGMDYFIGNENDVLERYFFCAKESKADLIVRVTCDCPFVDYNTIDEIVNEGIKLQSDYIIKDGLPTGVTAEAFTFEALKKAYFKANKPYQREHVISYFLDNPNEFELEFLKTEGALYKPNYRLTLDTEEDFNVIKTLYEELYFGLPVEIKDVINFLNKEKSILEINSHVKQKSYKEYH